MLTNPMEIYSNLVQSNIFLLWWYFLLLSYSYIIADTLLDADDYTGLSILDDKLDMSNPSRPSMPRYCPTKILDRQKSNKCKL